VSHDRIEEVAPTSPTCRPRSFRDGNVARMAPLLPLADRDPDPPEHWPATAATVHRVMTHLQAGMAAIARGYVFGAFAEFDQAGALRDTLPPDSPLLAALDQAVAQLNPLRPMMAAAPAPGTVAGRSPRETVEAELAPLRAAAAQPDQSRTGRALNLVVLAGAELAGAERRAALPCSR